MLTVVCKPGHEVVLGQIMPERYYINLEGKATHPRDEPATHKEGQVHGRPSDPGMREEPPVKP